MWKLIELTDAIAYWKSEDVELTLVGGRSPMNIAVG